MIERKAVCAVIFDDPIIAKGRKSGVQAVIVGLDLGFTIPALWAMLCPELLHSLPCLLGCDVVPRMGFQVVRCGALFRLDVVWFAVLATEVPFLRPFFVVLCFVDLGFDLLVESIELGKVSWI